MGLNFYALVADENDAKNFYNDPESFEYLELPGLDEFKLLTLVALLKDKPIRLIQFSMIQQSSQLLTETELVSPIRILNLMTATFLLLNMDKWTKSR